MNKKTSLKVIQKIGSIGVKRYSYRWPPPCMGILHQPVRPQSSKKTNSKFQLLVATLLAAVLVCSGTTASAKTLCFDITRSEGAKIVRTNTKELSGNVWKISNFDTSASNFIANEDVIGFRTRSTSGTKLSGYHTFSKFVYRYELKYTTVPAMGKTLKLHSQIDSTGDYNQISFEGEWIS